MLSLNRKTDYALVALAHLARTGQTGAAVSARALAGSYGMPRALLANLLKELHRAGLIDSIRGASGGYRLARPAGTITLSRVIEAIEGPVQVALCCHDEPAATAGHSAGAGEGAGEPASESEECLACRIERLCPISDAIQAMNGRFNAIFEHLTLRDLLDGRVSEAIREAVNDTNDVDLDTDVLKPSIEKSRE